MQDFSNLFPGARKADHISGLSVVIMGLAIAIGTFIYFVAGVAVANYVLGCLR